MKSFKKMGGLLIASLIMVSNAFAGEVYQFVSNGQYGQTWGGNAGINVSVDGSGVNQVARLVYYAYSQETGYFFWYGEIPASAVTMTGVASMHVQIDTCTISTLSGCGYVDVAINTNEPASGWVYTGVWQYSYGAMSVQYVGNSQVRFSSATGTVVGIPVSETNAAIGKYNNVSVSVSLGN